MSKVATPAPVKKVPEKSKAAIKQEEDVLKFVSAKLGKEVKTVADLQSGVVVCELANKLKPKSIEKFDAAPKTVLGKVNNVRKFNECLVKAGICPLDLPRPHVTATGRDSKKLLNVLHRLSIRALKLQTAPELVVRTQIAKAKRHRMQIRHLRVTKRVEQQRRILGAIRAARYQRFYKRLREHNIKRHMKAEKKGNFFVPAEPRVAFVIRLKGIIGMAPKPRKILQLFRLRQINNAVFVRLNKATLNMLKVIESYVAIGYPSVRSIRGLLLKRGFAKIHKSRIPITSNSMIAKYLGKYRVFTLDDLIFRIFTAGHNFAQVNRFLWPFKMNNPTGGFGRVGKLRHFVEGGAVGNRMGMINRFIQKCL